MNLTFRQAYLEYLEYAKLRQKPTSILTFSRKVEKHLIPYFGKLRIKKITTKEYLNWQKEIEKKGYGYRYKRNIHYCMTCIYEYLEMFYTIKRNIPKIVGNFKNDYKVKENYNTWNEIELNMFLNSINNKIYYVLFNLLFTTGIRKGEILALTFEDIQEDYIYINKTISKEKFNGARIITTPKTKKSIRKIQIDNDLIKEIENLKLYYKLKYKKFNDKYYVFGGEKPIATTTLERNKNKYCDIAKVKRITIHEFRHSNATILYEKGIYIGTIAKRLGHANINTTLSTYVHSNNNDEKKATELLFSLKIKE